MSKAKIYTKTGDHGQTSLVGGTRVAKTHWRLDAYGTLDELNSIIGLFRVKALATYPDHNELRALDSTLHLIQNDLFNIGSHFACEDESMIKHLPQLAPDHVKRLEADMDEWEAQLPPLKNFILPGGTELASLAHLARTVCRRAEREAVFLSQNATVEPEHIVFLNRLSDWFFVLSRKLNALALKPDIEWSKT